MNPAVWLVSRELTVLAGPWDEALTRDQDGEYLARLVAKSAWVKFVRASRSYYRQCNRHSTSRRTSRRCVESVFLAKGQAIQQLLSLEDTSRTREACLTHLSRVLHYL